MSEQQTASGADLVRQTLAAYRSTAKTHPAAAKKKPTRRRADRGDGRDPIGFGAVLARLNADQDWRVSLDGGSIIDRWATLCPQYDGLIQPVAFDAERGRLDLRPSSHAYATQLRLFSGQLGKQINDKLGRIVVKTIRTLPVGAIDALSSPEVQENDGGQALEPGPVRTRDNASDGYHRALRVHREHQAEEIPTNPLLGAAVARQTATLASAAYREPETAFADAVAERERVAEPEPDDRAEAIHRAALARAAAERAGGDLSVPRLFGAA